MLIRPVTLDDKDAVLTLAKAASIGMTSLPADEEVLIDKITRSVKSFDGAPDYPQGEAFLFVLEEEGKVVGTTGIKAHVGLTQPFYSYKLITITQTHSPMNIYSKHQMLQVTNDLTGASEIGSLYLLPEARGGGRGKLLSRCRFLFMAEFSDYFDEKVIAEMRGINDRQQHAPFYNSLAKHFFMFDFAEADYINATQGNQFIADLMPKYPIYVSLLPEEAQEAIGAPHPSSAPAKKLLEKEGFSFQGYLDVFDGGPTMEAKREHIHTIQQSQKVKVGKITDKVSDDPRALHRMICTTDFKDWRATLGTVLLEGGELKISEALAETLSISIGDEVRIAPDHR